MLKQKSKIFPATEVLQIIPQTGKYTLSSSNEGPANVQANSSAKSPERAFTVTDGLKWYHSTTACPPYKDILVTKGMQKR